MSTRLAKRSVPMFLAATLDVGYSTFGLGRYLQFNPKKVPPPTPDGREGRLFPPEQSSKSAQLLTELNRCRNKNFHKLCCSYGAIVNRNPAGRNFPLEGSLRAAFCPNFSPVAEADNARFNFT